jgi:hypothetical protein
MDLMRIRVRAALVEQRTALINAARGSAPRWQHPFFNEGPQPAPSQPAHQECEWKQGEPARERQKPF